MSLVSRWFRIPFWQRVLAGFVLGALAGWALGETAAAWFQPLGTLYVTMIKMIGANGFQGPASADDAMPTPRMISDAR